MSISGLSIILTAALSWGTALGPVSLQAQISDFQGTPTVKVAQLQIEPEPTTVDPRITRARSALASAYSDTDLSVLVHVKFGLNQLELFEVASYEFVSSLGARTAFEEPDLILRVQSLARKKEGDGESEIFGLTLHEGAETIAASRVTVNCQGENLKDISSKTPSGCLVDSATVSEMFGRLADKI